MAGDQKQQFTGRHLTNRRLTGPQSRKDTRHHEIRIESGSATYLPGDALGVHPTNSPALVAGILRALGASGDEPVPVTRETVAPLHRALAEVFNITTPTRRLVERFAAAGASDLTPLLERPNTESLKRYLGGWDESHDVLDVLEDHPGIRLAPVEFVETLRKAPPRLYSVASSLRAHPGEVHLLVVTVHYTIRGREREGVGSSWMADRWPLGSTAEFYLQTQQKHFAMPAEPSTPMIMIGPGTGLAPFRAFIEERHVTGARGGNWLFFGEQHRESDFFYEAELRQYEGEGLIRLDLAFSRDQAQKIYVQHRMREAARDLWAWLERGAEIFVCGDKDHMATDVDLELHRIAEAEGGLTSDKAREYVEALRTTKRYKRDVY